MAVFGYEGQSHPEVGEVRPKQSQQRFDCILEIGADRILFSTDYPFEEVNEAAEWFDGVSISAADRLKIGRQNALDLFKIKSR